MGIFSAVSNFFTDVGVITWDLVVTLGNPLRFSIPVGKVTPAGHPGYGGYWPEYRPPQEGDSRCCCPMLNAMANHGIIPRTGRGIKFIEITPQIHTSFNFALSFCSFTVRYAARMLKRDYNKDSFDLEELSLHNGIEHDASLTRADTAVQPNQAIKCEQFIEEMLSFATGKDADGNLVITDNDMSRIMGKRRAESKATNKDYSQAIIHRVFGSTNSAIMLKIFGGRVDDLRTILLEERLPEGWESRYRKRYGLTMARVNCTALLVELGIREADWAAGAKQLADSQAAAGEYA